jgi:hypothetical protein
MKSVSREKGRRAFLLSVAACALLSSGARAASDLYLTPDTSNPGTVVFNGQTFVNKGLVGAGRVASNLLDFRGETLGSFSGMAVVRDTWRRNGNTYTGAIFTLPDRGYNSGTVFSDYAARLHAYNITFTPYTAAANLAQSPASQNQLTLTPNGGFVFTDFLGQVTTGNNPDVGSKVENGFTLPSPVAGQVGAGKISIDAEAVAFLRDGSFYIGDEYTGGIYYFDPTGHMAGYLEPETALLPRAGTVLNFGADLNTVGRRTNQGMEGVSVTPDGTRLFAVLQSATLQDSSTNQETRNNTRVLVYDITGSRTPANPIEHYVLQLPVLDRDGTGPTPDRTAAQSEVLALNSSQFLLLTRDGNGLGVEDNRPLIFKSVYLVDTAGATNLAGSAFETGTAPVSSGFTATGATLASTINPVQATRLVNLISPTQLTHLGLTTAVTPLNPTASSNRISEKWESMALLPALDEAAPQDFFLFVGNDNDFATTNNCVMAGVANCNGPLVNDNVMMVWRLTLPTYVDPVFLDSMRATAPTVLTSLQQVGVNLASSNGRSISDHLNALRAAPQADVTPAQGAAKLGLNVWIEGAWSALEDGVPKSHPIAATVGAEFAAMPFARIGAAFGVEKSNMEATNGFDTDANGLQFSAYAAYDADGLFAQLSYTRGWSHFSADRPAGYGMSAAGETDGNSNTVSGEAGFLFPLQMLRLGPVGGAEWHSVDVDGYTELGAAGGNVVYPSLSADGWRAFVGAEAALPITDWAALRARGAYNFVSTDATNSATVRLATVQHVLGTQTLALPSLEQDFWSGAVDLVGGVVGNGTWHIGYQAEIGTDNGTAHRIFAGLNFAL